MITSHESMNRTTRILRGILLLIFSIQFTYLFVILVQNILRSMSADLTYAEDPLTPGDWLLGTTNVVLVGIIIFCTIKNLPWGRYLLWAQVLLPIASVIQYAFYSHEIGVIPRGFLSLWPLIVIYTLLAVAFEYILKQKRPSDYHNLTAPK